MRAEVFLVAVFVLFGMGAWLGTDRYVTRTMKAEEPSEEAEQLARQVPWRRDALSMTEKEREETEKQLIEARLDYYRQSAALPALPAPDAQADPKEAARKRGGAPAPLNA